MPVGVFRRELLQSPKTCQLSATTDVAFCGAGWELVSLHETEEEEQFVVGLYLQGVSRLHN